MKNSVLVLGTLTILAFSACVPQQQTGIQDTPGILASSPSMEEELVPQQASLYFIELGDGESEGNVGCGDTVVGVSMEEPIEVPASDTLRLVQHSLQKLLDVPEKEYGTRKLYNVLADSNLTIEDVLFEEIVAESPEAATGEKQVVVRLTGNLSLGGVCDNPRVEAQLMRTITQFPGSENARLLLNGEPLSEALSMQ